MGIGRTQSSLASSQGKETSGSATFEAEGTGTAFNKKVASMPRNHQSLHYDHESNRSLSGSLLPERRAGQNLSKSFSQRVSKWLRDWSGLSARQNTRLGKLRSSLEQQYGKNSTEQALNTVFPELGDGHFSLNKNTAEIAQKEAKVIDNFHFQARAQEFFSRGKLDGLMEGVDLNWAIQFKEDNGLNEVEMMTILNNAANDGKPLSEASLSTTSGEFLSAMQDFSTAANTTYNELSADSPSGQCMGAQDFLDVYTKALCSMAKKAPENDMSFHGTMQSFLVDRQSELRAAKKAYDTTASKKTKMSLVFLPPGSIYNRKRLEQSLQATSSLCKALNQKQLLSEEAHELQSFYAPVSRRKNSSQEALTDAELMSLANSGIAVDGLEMANKKGSVSVFPNEILEEAKSQLASMKDQKQHGDTGISDVMYADLGRADLFLGDKRVSHTAAGERVQDKAEITEALRQFCLDTDTGEVNENMLMAISQVANQGMIHAGPIGALITGKMPLHHGTSLIPDNDCKKHSSYSIEKNDAGDVTIECETKFYGGSFVSDKSDMMDSSKFLNIDAAKGGFYGYTVKVKFDKASYSRDGGMSPQPHLVGLKYTYNYKMS